MMVRRLTATSGSATATSLTEMVGSGELGTLLLANLRVNGAGDRDRTGDLFLGKESGGPNEPSSG
jgi:hypothetical protein